MFTVLKEELKKTTLRTGQVSDVLWRLLKCCGSSFACTHDELTLLMQIHDYLLRERAPKDHAVKFENLEHKGGHAPFVEQVKWLQKTGAYRLKRECFPVLRTLYLSEWNIMVNIRTDADAAEGQELVDV